MNRHIFYMDIEDIDNSKIILSWTHTGIYLGQTIFYSSQKKPAISIPISDMGQTHSVCHSTIEKWSKIIIDLYSQVCNGDLDINTAKDRILQILENHLTDEYKQGNYASRIVSLFPYDKHVITLSLKYEKPENGYYPIYLALLPGDDKHEEPYILKYEEEVDEIIIICCSCKREHHLPPGIQYTDDYIYKLCCYSPPGSYRSDYSPKGHSRRKSSRRHSRSRSSSKSYSPCKSHGKHSRSCSISKSRSPCRSYRRNSRSRSKSNSRSPCRSHRRHSRSRSKSNSRSPCKSHRKHSRSRSKSHSNSRSRSKSRRKHSNGKSPKCTCPKSPQCTCLSSDGSSDCSSSGKPYKSFWKKDKCDEHNKKKRGGHPKHSFRKHHNKNKSKCIVIWESDGYLSEPNSSHRNKNKKYSHRYYYDNPHDGYDSDISYNRHHSSKSSKSEDSDYSSGSDSRSHSDRSDYFSVSDYSKSSVSSRSSDCPKSSNCSKFSDCPKSSDCRKSSKCSSKCDDSYRNDHGRKFSDCCNKRDESHRRKYDDDCDDCDDYHDYGIPSHRVYEKYSYERPHYESNRSEKRHYEGNHGKSHYEQRQYSAPLYLKNDHYNYHPLRKLQPFYKCQTRNNYAGAAQYGSQSYGRNDVQKSNESYDDYCRRYYAQH